MSTRALLGLWLVVGLFVWNGVFDLHVSRGAREYLQFAAEAELDRRPVPSMIDVMAHSGRDGFVASTMWALLVTGAGWATVAGARRSSPRTDAPGPDRGPGR